METPYIIDSFAALPVGTWLQILALQEDTAREDIDKQVGTIALLTGRTERDILNLPLAEYSHFSSKAAFLAEAPARLPRVARTYRAGTYILRPALDLQKITAAQYIDFQTFAPEGDKRLVELLSIALVPEGAGYNDGSYDIDAVKDAIREYITVAQALSLTAFFLTRYASLMRRMRISLSRLVKTEKDKEKKEALTEKLAEMERVLDNLRSGGGG